MCTPSRREAHIGQKRVPCERESRGKAEFSQKSSKSRALKKCTPSRQTIHFGEERAPGERQSPRKAENYRKLQKHMCLKRCAPSRREGHLGRFGVFGLSWKTPPGVQSPYKAAITKNGWFNFWALDPKPLDFRLVPCCDLRGGRGGKTNEQDTPPGALEGI